MAAPIAISYDSGTLPSHHVNWKNLAPNFIINSGLSAICDGKVDVLGEIFASAALEVFRAQFYGINKLLMHFCNVDLTQNWLLQPVAFTGVVILSCMAATALSSAVLSTSLLAGASALTVEIAVFALDIGSLLLGYKAISSFVDALESKKHDEEVSRDGMESPCHSPA